ncbi:S-adenosyl-L-methionine-dependent methyltransferase [Micractinium conductrix]|uniref:S-adenosyl-L-methionine-dependent methyltransferase n=1 Tax=Micractinium conductrix TaxID=554055 RepID=A0A2P6VEZ4_9CHLO|nr:S-adenosyl-L-methionine-dependent methyltransferase [Micractinium conductrix]|eukprot:PSC72662.1 S-adenosyl-L-methionine-dependent methyltransferase [Micractinium conductrix]
MSGEELHKSYSARWENMWTQDGVLKPGQAFDAAKSSPALSAQLASGGLDVCGKRVLVPGCGRGYDLVEFARAGAGLAAGLELAPTAAAAAEAYLGEALSGEEAAHVQVHSGDFFAWKCPTGEAFDLGFDYTFMCALHPNMRADWATSWARLLAPGATLACLAFPLNHDKETGPPWPVTEQMYKDLLLPAGFTLVREEPVPAELSHAGRGGKEALLVFRRT